MESPCSGCKYARRKLTEDPCKDCVRGNDYDDYYEAVE